MEAQLLMARGASRAKLPADSDAAAAGHVEQALADFDASLGLQEQAPTYNAMGNVLKAARRREEAMHWREDGAGFKSATGTSRWARSSSAA